MTLARWTALLMWLLAALIASTTIIDFSTGIGASTMVALLLCCAFCSSAITWHQTTRLSALWLTLVLLGLATLIAMKLDPAVTWQRTLGPAGAERLALLAACWTPAALFLYYRSETQSRMLPSLTPVIIGGSALLCLLVLRLPAQQLLSAIAAWWALQFGLALAALLAATRRRQRHALPMLLSLLAVVLAVTADWLRLNLSSSFPHDVSRLWSPFAIVFFVLTQIWIYIERFSDVQRLATRLSRNLQRAVELRTHELSAQNQKLEQAQTALQQANASLQRLSITDGLTQTHNRMYFEEQLAQEWRRCARQLLPLSVLMIDADNFKQLNDSAGHLAGDRCLQALAETLRQQFRRAGELLARYGGEEFVVLLPDTNQSQALALAEGLRIAVEALSIEHNGLRYRVTVSIGVSTALPPTAEEPPELLLAAADSALYEAKAAGRNRVHSLPLAGQRRLATQQQLRL